MINFTIILIILTALLLIISTAFQNSKKEGGGNTLGNMGAHQIIGVQKTSDLLERSTWILIIILFILSIGTFALVKSKSSHTILKSPNLERIQQKKLFLESTTIAEAEGAVEPSSAPIDDVQKNGD